MKNFKTILAGATALGAASLAFSTPAAAQYGGYGPYGNNGAAVVTQILNQVLGYGTYPYGNYGYNRTNPYQSQAQQQQAVNQCARATEARLNGQQYGYRTQGYGYPQQGYGYPNQGYSTQRYPVPGTPVPPQGYGYPNQGYNSQGYPVPGTPVPQGAYGYPNQPVNAAYANRVTGITKVKRTSYGHHVYGVASTTNGYAPAQGQYGTYSRPNYEWDCKVDRYGRIRDIDIDRVKSRDYRYRRY